MSVLRRTRKAPADPATTPPQAPADPTPQAPADPPPTFADEPGATHPHDSRLDRYLHRRTHLRGPHRLHAAEHPPRRSQLPMHAQPAPLAPALLIAGVGSAILTTVVGTVRITQLRRLSRQRH
jgi:hypothetical protein